MHLDLSTLIDADTQLGIDELAEDYLDAPLTLLWPRWVTMYDEGELPLFVYQAAAQQLAAYACVFSQLQFGLFCSKHYPMHGPSMNRRPIYRIDPHTHLQTDSPSMNRCLYALSNGFPIYA